MTWTCLAPGGVPSAGNWHRVETDLARGAVVAFPTETFYGLGCDPRLPEAVNRLLALKGGRGEKALPLIAVSPVAARAAVALDGEAEIRLWRRLAAAFWPGPLTLVARALPGLAPGVVHGDGTLAIRVSGAPLARRLAGACGGMIVATSANVSGQPPPVTAAAAMSGLGPGLDLLVDGGPAPGGSPSTLVAITGGAARVLRKGAVAVSRIKEAAGPPPGKPGAGGPHP